jgi:nuclear pore complex protein Nup85
MRETFLFDFGTVLMSRKSLFEIGLDYLEYSSSEGIGAREMLLTRIPIENETQAMKLINVARKFGLVNAESEICKVMVKRSLQKNRFGNALEWAIRSRENVYVTDVANVFLYHYCNTGEVLCEDLLANIGDRMLAYPRLLFLVQYYEFHKFYRFRELSNAARVLVKLLDSDIIPEFFWPSLLADAIPLLEHKEPIIPTEETYRILHHLENDLIPFLEKQEKNNVNGNSEGLNLLNGCPDDLVQMLRLTCARNLARAVIIENTLVL